MYERLAQRKLFLIWQISDIFQYKRIRLMVGNELMRSVDQGNFVFLGLYSNTSKVLPFGEHLDLLLASNTSIMYI